MAAINDAAADIEAIRGMNSPFLDTLLDVYVQTLSMEYVKTKQEELEADAKKASLTTVEKVTASIGVPAQTAGQITPANTEDGTVMKIYATQNQMNQITDFMKAIGVRYELI